MKYAVPGDIPDMLCDTCRKTNVEHSGCPNFAEDYWACPGCDSTYPSWLYPLKLHSKCHIWGKMYVDDQEFPETE